MKKFIQRFQNQLITISVLLGIYAAVIIMRQEMYYKSCKQCTAVGTTDTALICIAVAVFLMIIWACLPSGPKSSQSR